MGKELNIRRLEFFRRCVESLKKQLPRQYVTPLAKDNNCWQWIYKPMDHVYFEWVFCGPRFSQGPGFAVGLHFECRDAEENKKLLDMFRPLKKRLEAKLGQSVQFDDDWRHIWARLYVWTPDREMSVEPKAAGRSTCSIGQA